jgi:hypothetical protein
MSTASSLSRPATSGIWRCGLSVRLHRRAAQRERQADGLAGQRSCISAGHRVVVIQLTAAGCAGPSGSHAVLTASTTSSLLEENLSENGLLIARRAEVADVVAHLATKRQRLPRQCTRRVGAITAAWPTAEGQSGCPQALRARAADCTLLDTLVRSIQASQHITFLRSTGGFSPESMAV